MTEKNFLDTPIYPGSGLKVGDLVTVEEVTAIVSRDLEGIVKDPARHEAFVETCLRVDGPMFDREAVASNTIASELLTKTETVALQIQQVARAVAVNRLAAGKGPAAKATRKDRDAARLESKRNRELATMAKNKGHQA